VKSKLWIDTREPDSIKHGLPVELGMKATIEELSCGDIRLIEHGRVMLIERKTALDLLGSIGDGRLVDQCARMAEECTLPVVLCHGDIKCAKDGSVVADGRATRWNYWSLQMQILSIQAGGIMYLQVRKGDLADAIKALQEWLRKDSHLRVARRDPLPFLVSRRDLEVLASLPGIGAAKAPAILKFYSSLGWALAGLTHKDAKYPKGIGKGIVKNTRDLMKLKDDERLELVIHGEEK